MSLAVQRAALRRWESAPAEERVRQTARARAVRDAQFVEAVRAAEPNLSAEECDERVRELRSAYYRSLRQRGIDKRRAAQGAVRRDGVLDALAEALTK